MNGHVKHKARHRLWEACDRMARGCCEPVSPGATGDPRGAAKIAIPSQRRPSNQALTLVSRKPPRVEPCLTATYDAFDRVYGPDFRFTRTTTEPAALERAAVDFLAGVQSMQNQDPALMAALASNHRLGKRIFPRRWLGRLVA